MLAFRGLYLGKFDRPTLSFQTSVGLVFGREDPAISDESGTWKWSKLALLKQRLFKKSLKSSKKTEISLFSK